MQILEELPLSIKNSAVCIGKFDGFHLGHMRLIRSVLNHTEENTVIFSLRNEQNESLFTLKEQRRMARQLGFSYFVSFKDLSQIYAMDAEEFIQTILVDQCDLSYICAGKDFRFGNGRKGDVKLLQQKSSRFGYQCVVVEDRIHQGERISSTRVKNALKDGDLNEVTTMLGRPFFVYDTVKPGEQLGRTIGFPTANFSLPSNKCMPPHGVYGVKAEIGKKFYYGMANLGLRPTVSKGDRVTLEVHFLDYSGNLYNKDIQVDFLYPIREEKKFDSLEALQHQLEMDAKTVKKTVKKP